MKRQNYENGTVKKPVVCVDWSEAFDVTRERGRPTVCTAKGRTKRCFPSGHCEDIKA